VTAFPASFGATGLTTSANPRRTTGCTAHRLGDMRRLVCQYGRAQNTVFPTGRDHKGGEYGSDVNFAVSSDERNNPKFTGCIDRSA
jgi:hypothetical protein